MSPEDIPAMKDALDNAANAIKRGDLGTGKEGLKWVLEREPNNALAWLRMSRCVETSEAKLECFNRVLAIDPSNRHALEGVQRFGGGAKRGRRLKNTERTPVGWGFWLMWVLASTVGLVVGFAVGAAVGVAVGVATGALMAGLGALFFMGLVIGVAVGVASAWIAQWLVLRRQVSRAGWWVLASIVGVAIGFAIGLFALSSMSIAVGAASIGIAQWLVLRRQVSRAGWWVLASTVGLPAAFVVGVAVSGAVGGVVGEVGWVAVFGVVGEAVEAAVGIAVGVAVGGAVFGAITGSVLVWLLRQPVAKELSLPQDAA